MSRGQDAEAADTKTISVIVPAYNAAHYLELSLPPLVRMRERGDILEVIVVDDCSPDPSNVATAERLGATVLKMPKNGGPGAARNYAARLALGDILWLVDADVVVHENSASLIRKAFESDPGVSAVFGSYDRDPPAKNFASSYKNLVHRYYHQRGKTNSDTFWSGCGAIRRDVYFELGGFDGARYGRPSIEDIEFGFRMRKAGWKITLIHELLGTHLKHWSLKEVVRTDIFQRAIPWSYLILSGRAMSDDLNVSNAERVKAVMAGLWAISLLALLAPPLWPGVFYAALASTAAVGALNFALFSFFKENRGAAFALKALAYHQFYYLYSAVTFVLCALAFHFGGKKDFMVAKAKDTRAPA